MKIKFNIFFIGCLLLAIFPMRAQNTIMKPKFNFSSDLMTPEDLWAMGRIGSVTLSPDGKNLVYAVTYYSKEKNSSHTHLNKLNIGNGETFTYQISKSCSSPQFLEKGTKVAFLAQVNGVQQVFTMDVDGKNLQQVSFEKSSVIDFLPSPDGKKIIFIKEVPQTASISPKESDLPQATGMVIHDLMYKHWDHYVTTIPHPFVADWDGEKWVNSQDLLEGEPFECPTEPFGGMEELAWSPDSKLIAYSCRKKTGISYAISTDTDIYLYDLSTKKTINVCKPDDFQEPQVDPTRSLENQCINSIKDAFPGYDALPKFSPDGKYLAWTSMLRGGYESDRTRLCIMNLKTKSKVFVTEAFESGVNDYVWNSNSKDLYFTGVWHGTTQVYKTNLKGKIERLTSGQYDYAIAAIDNANRIIAKRHSMSSADELYSINPKNGQVSQLTFENKELYDHLTFGTVQERWIKTTDNKEMLAWVIYPPHFDPNRKYPTLLFCEGGPQSPVSQFWSYRWNFQIMAANGYIIIAPNRRGLPGFGMKWLEEISGDYTGQCMQDYLSAIDDISKEKYVDKDHLGAVGASFGGFSVYWLAGNHNKRFKAFIAHDGIYNVQQQYVETEELWFPNWDFGAAPWIKECKRAQKVFNQSPHLYVDKWDTPILCIHGQKDFRIEYTQAESAFTAAKLRGIPAELLLFPDENHWVLKPQNGILWQRTFFKWLDKWLK